MTDLNLVDLTADVVAAYVTKNPIATGDVAGLIQGVHAAFARIEGNAAQPEQAPAPVPAVPIRSSVKNDHLVCLEDGAKLTMLKRYLRTRYDMTPEDYRAKWGLPRDYPMVAPAYAERRRELAVKIGLGRKRATKPESKKAQGRSKAA